MNRRTVAIAILCVWGVALAWLGLRELSPAGANPLADDLRTVSPTAAYYTLTGSGRQLGFASYTLDTVPTGLVVDDRLILEIPRGGALRRTAARTLANLTNTLRLRDFVATVNTPEGNYAIRGEMAGDSVLELALEAEDGAHRVEVAVDDRVVLTSYLPLHLASNHQLAPGDTLTVSAFDPLRLRAFDIDVRVLAESTLTVPDSAAFDAAANRWVEARMDTVRAWYLEQEAPGSMARGWIDELGRIVHIEPASGLRVARSAFEVAFYNLGLQDSTEIVAAIEASGIAWHSTVGAALPAAPPADSLRFLVTGADPAHLALDGGRQRLAGDTLAVRRERPDALQPTYGLPADSATYGPYLVQDPLVQADDPFIQAQARQIVGRTRNPRTAARLLVEWIDGELEKRPASGFPSAPQILDTRAGDTSEHALLYVAMARAVGLPARTVTGLLYAAERFYFHSWPEVELGNGWVAVDPTLGQFPADAAHVRLAVGGLARQIELPQFIGRLSLDVVATEDEGR